MTDDLSDAEVILYQLDFDTNWLLEESNRNPDQFVGREQQLYSILNKLQLVASRFAKVLES